MTGSLSAPQRRRRAVNGVLVLDKPRGMTSNAVLQRVKWLYRAEKAGHTGALDPLATGVLPLCFGEATKFSQYLLDADKTYRATVRLGVTTDTGDADGRVLSEQPVPALRDEELDSVLAGFRGEQSQVPSMYSALKRDGRPLYELARKGMTVEREPRSIHVQALERESRDGDTFVFVARVSKGTYIRSLAEDIGRAIGCGAHVTALRRLSAGGLDLSRAVTLDEIERAAMAGNDEALLAMLLPSDTALEGWPVVTLSPESAYHTRRGQRVRVGNVQPGGRVAIYEDAGAGRRVFLGVGDVTDDGRLAPRRLVSTA